RSHGAKEKLCAGWIGAGEVGIVQPARLGGVEGCNRGIARNHKIRVVTEPLQTTVPYVAMNVVVGARGQPEKFNVPDCSQGDPDDAKAPGKCAGGLLAKELTDREEVSNPRYRERSHEWRPAAISKVARADGQRDENDAAEQVHSRRRRDFHNFLVPVR